jgi:hypothetical protein
MGIAPGAERVLHLGEEPGDCRDDRFNPGFIGLELRERGQAGECVSEDIGFGIGVARAVIIVVNIWSNFVDRFPALVEKITGG